MDNIQSDNEKSGCYYFTTFYPSNLSLPEKASFIFEYEERNVVVFIHRRIKSLVINDFSNKIIRTEEHGLIKHAVENKEILISNLNMAAEIEHSGYFIIDHNKHLHKEIYNLQHAEIIISFETFLNFDNYEFSKRVLKYFIESYRMVSHDVLTLSQDKIPFYTKIYKYDFHLYSDKELKLTEKERLKLPRDLQFKFHEISIPFWNTQGKKLIAKDDEIVKNLKEFLDGKKTPGLLTDFILRASEELNVHKNFKYSLIESWTALEIAIVSYLKDLKLAKGISKNKIDGYETNVGISYLINIELPLVHATNDNEFKELLLSIDSVRKLRNKVIHDNKQVLEEDAANAIKALICFLTYIGYKKY